MIQRNYDKSLTKRQLQRKYYGYFTKPKLRTMLGPNLIGCVKNIQSVKKFRLIESYELNESVYIEQQKQLRSVKTNVKIHLGDIIKALKPKNFAYDIDCTCGIACLRSMLRRLKDVDEFILTVAVRPIDEAETVRIFQSYIGTHFIHELYNDTGTPMIMFIKNPIFNK